MKTAIVVGNPRRGSRTLLAAERLAQELVAAPADHVIEVVDLGAGLLEWGDVHVDEAVATVASCDLVIVASPTYKAAYTGLLKLFLDRFATGVGLEGVVAVPLMLGGAWNHALAPELVLKPVLAEIGATTALPGLYLLDSAWDTDGRLEEYAMRWAPTLQRLTHS